MTVSEAFCSMCDARQLKDVDSLRLFVNLDYLKGAPLKIGVASATSRSWAPSPERWES
jgi:hypothetical protein